VKAGSILFLLLFLAPPVFGSENDSARLFIDKVKPLLDSRCISCHGPDKVKGGLRLDSREALIKGGDSGPALNPGKPAESLLLQAVMHTKKDLEMPPKEKLTRVDVSVLEQWILNGAPWPSQANLIPDLNLRPGEKLGDAWTDPRNPITRIFGGQRLDLWSLKPIRRPVSPSVQKVTWPKNTIDYFVLAKLESSGLKPSPEADRRTLARRLYFDLTGLPPTPEQVQEFLQDSTPRAYERLVDKLLESPRYGEHWARQWLDVIRYSDSNGFDWDEFRPLAWRFRDYVIRSLNSDKPFNQFVREQLAGDELLDGPPHTPQEQDYLIATGYLRLGPHDNSAPLFNEQARSRSELMSDLVETTSSAFLGVTMGCCRCHDHKFDPLSQADHFRMRAFFEGVKFADDRPLDLADQQEEIRKHNEQIDARIKPLQLQKDELLDAVKKRLREASLDKLSPEDRALLQTAKDQSNEESKKKIEELEKKIIPSSKDISVALNEDEKKREKELADKIETLKKEKRDFSYGLLMTDAEGQPPATKILFQGDYKQERAPVQPGFISVLDPNPAPIHKGINSKTTGRRLTLANWIVSSSNPLTARVVVNRLWQGHFGQGLVATANDFGLSGARPTHPELLDWLASEFVRQGWSLKKLHKQIVMSATYRQCSAPSQPKPSGLKFIGHAQSATTIASKIDSDNKLLWRQNIRRLSAEQLRDSLLKVSGKLKDCDGGPPVWPVLLPELLTANPALLDDNDAKTKGWYPSSPERQDLRSIYLVQKRTVRIPFMETFDLPENATSCPRRNESIVAPQALSLLNGPLSLSAVTGFAERVQRSCGTDIEKSVREAFGIALQRAPAPDELSQCAQFVQQQGLKEFCRSLLNLNEFVYVD
jgi:hypothetical protein